MANKQAKYTFGGANQDLSKYKHAPQYYFEAQHIKILTTDTQSTGGGANEKGNEIVITIPSIDIKEDTNIITYGMSSLPYKARGEISSQIAAGILPIESSTQIITGHTTTRDSIVLFTSDDLGMDCIWTLGNVLEGNYNLKLIYLRNMGFSKVFPIQAIFNYENINIQKVYWVDGNQQVRNLNLRYSEIEGNSPIIEIPLNSINFVGNVKFSQPVVQDILGGGTHTTGMIQYTYNLFRLNGSQTKLAPLSEIIPLDKGDNLGGGDLNEVLGVAPSILIDNIDQSYTNLNVYAIKYTSYNELPSISLIEEIQISGRTSVNVFDYGDTISSLSLSEFLFLGSNPIIPKHIESKDNRLFLANIKDIAFDMPEGTLDYRAYSFPISSESTTVWKNPQLDVSGLNVDTLVNATTLGFGGASLFLESTHDATNLKYDIQKYKRSSTAYGGTGIYIEYEIVQKTTAQLETNPNEYRFLKDGEIYRIGIEFYNNLGQTSPPKWIADFRTPDGNLLGNYNTLKVSLTPAFHTFLDSYTFEDDADIPIGYRIIRADRTLADRTIICQGALTGMMVQTTEDKITDEERWSQESEREDQSKREVKIPVPVSRTFESVMEPINKTSHLSRMNRNSDYYRPVLGVPYQGESQRDPDEIHGGSKGDDTRQQSWQYTELMQMHSPEILFEQGLRFGAGLTLKTKGLVNNTTNGIIYKRVNDVTGVVTLTTTGNEDQMANTIFEPNQVGPLQGTLLPGDEYIRSFTAIDDNIRWLGLFGPTTASNIMDFLQFSRKYNTFIPSSTGTYKFPILGAPEITGRGQGPSSYNGNSELKYANSLEGFKTDQHEDNERASIYDMNSYGSRCITLALNKFGPTSTFAPEAGIPLEEVHAVSFSDAVVATGDPKLNGLLLGEITLTETAIYLGNVYGGNSYEAKSRTNYISIGKYSEITGTDDFIQIDNAGDTYVDTFTFTRISKKDVEVLDDQVLQTTEIVEFLVETTVDLKNRNDISRSDWQDVWQPAYIDYHKYNKVYSQQPNLVGNKSIDVNFRRINDFDTRIQATKLKIPNETIDSWTDVLAGEVMDLDGKFGPINSILAFKDNMYSFQDEAIASVVINPRVQIQSNDGIGLELGTGGILYDYNYLSTKSGSINKWSVIQTKKGIYYYDALNKGIGRVPDMTQPLLSDIKGLHGFFNINYDYTALEIDNPIIGSGVNFGYDNYNNDVYFSLLQGDKSFTWCYNELVDSFVDLKTYVPSRYISKGEKFIIPNTTNDSLFEQYAGDYNVWFGTPQPSYITLMLNPESDYDSIFNTIDFTSELYLNDIDQPTKTLTHIHAWNEYQDSGRIELVNSRGSNLRRKFREWKANIPRENRNRTRNPWIFLKLELENESNYKFILHDIIVNYTV